MKSSYNGVGIRTILNSLRCDHCFSRDIRQPDRYDHDTAWSCSDDEFCIVPLYCANCMRHFSIKTKITPHMRYMAIRYALRPWFNPEKSRLGALLWRIMDNELRVLVLKSAKEHEVEAAIAFFRGNIPWLTYVGINSEWVRRLVEMAGLFDDRMRRGE